MTDRGPREGRFAPGTSLRRAAARGTIINGAFLTLINLLAMLRGAMMAGFLSREEYGVWGVLVVLITTMVILRQVGIGDRFVQQDEEDQEGEFHRAFTLELAVAVTLAVVGTAVLLGMASAYDTPEIVGPGLIMLATFPLGALQFPLMVFYRRLQFGRQRLLQAFDPLIAFGVTLGLALAGYGYWALVWGSVAGISVSAVVAVIASPYKLRLRWDSSRLRAYGSFSWPIFVAGLSRIGTAQGMTAIAEATLGLAGVGVIALTSQISQMADRADRAITATLYPAISAVKDRMDLLQETLLKSNRIALIWSIPFGLGVALFSEDLLVRVLGERWEPGVELMQATAVALAIHQIGFNWSSFYTALGNTRPIAWAALVGALTMGGVILPLLAFEGLDGLALGVVLAECIFLVMRGVFLRRLFPTLRFAPHIVRAVWPTLPAVAVVLVARELESGDRGLGIAAVEAVAFLAITAGITVWAERPLLREALGYLRKRPAAA